MLDTFLRKHREVIAVEVFTPKAHPSAQIVAVKKRVAWADEPPPPPEPAVKPL